MRPGPFAGQKQAPTRCKQTNKVARCKQTNKVARCKQTNKVAARHQR
jgi:hypothetical protein